MILQDCCAQAAVSLGVVIAQGVNAGAQDIYPWGWRLSIALASIPACAFLVSAWLLPDTPTSLLARGRPDLVGVPFPPLEPLPPLEQYFSLQCVTPLHSEASEGRLPHWQFNPNLPMPFLI